MYESLVLFQLIGIIALWGAVLIIIGYPASKMKEYLLAAMICVLINQIGYYFELTATNKELALYATKFTYFGKTFIVLLFFLLLLEVCKIKLNNSIKLFLGSLHFVVSLLVMNCEKNNLFYNKIEWTESGFFPHLILGHGIVYKIYSFLLLFYFLIALVIIVYRYRKINEVTQKKQLFLIGCSFVISILGFVLFISGVTKCYDSTSLTYVVGAIIMVVSVLKYQFLETMALAKSHGYL